MSRKLKPGDPKPYPRRCAGCGKSLVRPARVAHHARIKHDGKLHEFRIAALPVDRCTGCKEVFFTNASSDAKLVSLRNHLGLLQIDEIRKRLAQNKMSQRDFAGHLRVAEETVSRWLNGMSIQSRSLDTLMRLYFSMPAVRKALASVDNVQI